MYTNIERRRRYKNVPTILTATAVFEEYEEDDTVEVEEQPDWVDVYAARLEMFCSISATKSVPVSPVLFFEILRGHIASPPRAKIGQALSPCERELVLINNVLTSETKAAKKELFIGTLHALSG